MKVMANPNKLPHLLDNQVGAVKDFLGIPRGEALPMTKPVLCILFIVGVVCNGTGTMRRFAATSKMDLATFAIMEPQEILEVRHCLSLSFHCLSLPFVAFPCPSTTFSLPILD